MKTGTLKLEKLFDEYFKFKVNQEVRHKGDKKQYEGMHDMGLLILSRNIHEEVGDNDERIFKKTYHCRTINFSGSGQIILFSEKELQSIKDWDKSEVERKIECDEIRTMMKIVSAETYKSFGVESGSEVFLNKKGKVDKSKRYRVTGFSNMEGKRRLSLMKVGITDGSDNNVKIASPKEITVIKENKKATDK